MDTMTCLNSIAGPVLLVVIILLIAALVPFMRKKGW
jgi:hypothetical protein